MSGRRKKSPPFAVRLPTELADWVNHYTAQQGITRTELITEALKAYRRSRDERRQVLYESIERTNGVHAHD